MTHDDSPFEAAVKELCTGSEEAIQKFIQTYGPHIQRVVRRRLHHKLRSKFDSVDFVQMVWASFFATPDRISQFEKPEEPEGFELELLPDPQNQTGVVGGFSLETSREGAAVIVRREFSINGVLFEPGVEYQALKEHLDRVQAGDELRLVFRRP